MNFIETYSGIPFRPLSPERNDICIKDIAHALSHQCRFAGHTRTFYSVAEHSVRVSILLQDQGHTPQTILWGLLHDASEYALVDIPTPLKQSTAFSAYRDAEIALMKVICERFGMAEKEPPAVRTADAVLLATEARDLMPSRPEHWGALTQPPLEKVIFPWTSTEAERCFLVRFASYYGRV